MSHTSQQQQHKARKKKSSYHIVMVPEDSSQIHRVRLRPWQFRGILIGLVGLVLGLAVTGGGYIRYQGLYHKTVGLRGQLASMQSEQSRLAQRLVQLEETVERAEGVAQKVGFLVTPQPDGSYQAVGPIQPL